jgi:hypothetical protein
MVAKAHLVSSTFNPFVVRRYTEKNFSVDRMAAEYAAIYEEMLEGAARKKRTVAATTL